MVDEINMTRAACVVAIICGLLLLVIGVGIVAYFIAYRHHINKVLAADAFGMAGKTRRMPSVASTVLTLCAIAAVLFAVFMMVTVISLGNRLDELNSTINDRMSSLQNSMLSVYDYVDDTIKKQNSLVTSAEFEIGEYDEATHRAKVRFIVVPKSTSGDAKLAVTAGGETVALSHAGGGRYEGFMMADIFTDYDDCVLMISDSAGIRTEALDIIIGGLFYEFLPSVVSKPEFSGDTDGPRRAIMHITATDAARDAGHKLVSMRLITEADGKKTDERDITSILSKPDKSDIMSVDIPSDAETFTAYVYATDSAGYTYEFIALECSREGLADDEIWAVHNYDVEVVVTIKDKNGKVLRSAKQ